MSKCLTIESGCLPDVRRLGASEVDVFQRDVACVRLGPAALHADTVS